MTESVLSLAGGEGVESRLGVVGVATLSVYVVLRSLWDNVLEETNLVVGDRWGDDIVIGQASESLWVGDRSDGSLESRETEGTRSDIIGESSEDQLVKCLGSTGCDTSEEERSVS